MLVFDMFYYSVCRFLAKILKRDKYDAKESALLYLTLYIGGFLYIQIISTWGLLADNYIIRWLVDGHLRKFFASIIVGIIVGIIFWIRYFKIYDIEDIERKILSLPKIKRLIYKCLNILIMIGFPVGTFCLYRLYVYGHV